MTPRGEPERVGARDRRHRERARQRPRPDAAPGARGRGRRSAGPTGCASSGRWNAGCTSSRRSRSVGYDRARPPRPAAGGERRGQRPARPARARPTRRTPAEPAGDDASTQSDATEQPVTPDRRAEPAGEQAEAPEPAGAGRAAGGAGAGEPPSPAAEFELAEPRTTAEIESWPSQDRAIEPSAADRGAGGDRRSVATRPGRPNRPRPARLTRTPGPPRRRSAATSRSSARARRLDDVDRSEPADAAQPLEEAPPSEPPPAEVEAYPSPSRGPPLAVAAAAGGRMPSRPARPRPARAPSARAAAPRIARASPSAATAASGWSPPALRRTVERPGDPGGHDGLPALRDAQPRRRRLLPELRREPAWDVRPATCRRRWLPRARPPQPRRSSAAGRVLGPVVLLIGMRGASSPATCCRSPTATGSLFDRACGRRRLRRRLLVRLSRRRRRAGRPGLLRPRRPRSRSWALILVVLAIAGFVRARARAGSRRSASSSRCCGASGSSCCSGWSRWRATGAVTSSACSAC